MNYIDTYDTAAGSATPPVNAQGNEQTLNEEVTQVLGNIGRFWGGFKKQSATALVSARKDLSDVVVQAQKELTKLSTADSTAAATPAASTSGTTAANDKSEAGRGSSEATEPPTVPATSQTSTLFSRIQSSLPPNIVSTLQNNLPESLKHASESIDLAQLRTTLTTEFQRVQGVTRAQAEEYVHKSEGLLREAMKEAGEVLRDAVKIVPPQEGETANVGTSWDGTDFWMMPSTAEETPSVDKGKGREASGSGSGRPSGEFQRAVATRAESLLKRLRQDPDVIRRDPRSDDGVRELYDEWLASDVTSKEGGIEGKEWADKCFATVNEGEDLGATQEVLVPTAMTKQVFWTRYFFRVHQIEREEEKRKALLQGATQNEEDFSWEDDDDDNGVPTTATVPTTTNKTLSRETTPSATAHPTSASESVPTLSSSTPNRVGSEDDFDLVSNVSTNVSATGDVAPSKHSSNEKEKSDGEDPDSDWE